MTTTCDQCGKVKPCIVDRKAEMWVRFDQMTWPAPCNEMSDLEWRLRYQPDVKREDLLAAASVISAYMALIDRSQKRRNYICQQIKLRTESEGTK